MNSDGGEVLLDWPVLENVESNYLNGQELGQHGGNNAVEQSTRMLPLEYVM